VQPRCNSSAILRSAYGNSRDRTMVFFRQVEGGVND
jgi:hypothetical protein